MKTLNKFNLSIARLTLPDESRFVLSAVYVTPECTIETDGHQLMIVTLADVNTLPGTDLKDETPKFKPFLLPKATALKLARELPGVIRAVIGRMSKKKSKTPPKPKRELVIGQNETDDSTLTVLDGQDSLAFRVGNRTGTFPNYKLILPPKEGMKFAIAFNPKLLLGVMREFASFSDYAVIRLDEDNKPVRIDARNDETGQDMTAVIMPMTRLNDKV